ncbi:proline-rich extensin-like protein EPR1 isoform X4 [Medicago truncatula]|uniref:proline-rich extensin-like protein EPR1 isoform X4 n=1 Tax=Medicago truncatula TaxID=3880 RepID=UPI000D2F39E0|nr:proline-rich extensin-like protein EPR1 isoform X4 [Medicago truncatula]
MSSGGTNPPNDMGKKDVASTTTGRTRKYTRKWRTHLAPQHVLDQLMPMPPTKDTQTGKDVASTTTRPTRQEIRVDKSIPMPTAAHIQTPSPHTYAPPPPTHTSSPVYPQHAYAPPKHTPSGYTLPPIYPPPIYPHHAYAPSANTPPTNPLSGGPSHIRPPSGKGKGVGSTTTSHSLKVTCVVSSSPDQCIPVPTTAHTQIPSSHTYAPPPPTHTSSAVYQQNAYAPPKLTPSGYTLPPTYSHHAYAPSVNPPPTNPLSGGPLHKRPPSGKGKSVGSTTASHSHKVTPVVSSSPDQFIPVPMTAHTQIPSPHTYVPPPPTSSQSPSTQFPLHVYPVNAYAPPAYTPSTYALPTYSLSSEPSKKRPPSDKGEDIASTTNGRSRKVTRVVSGSPLDQFIPMPMTAHTRTPSSHTYTLPPPTRSQSPSTQFPLPVYPPHAYAPPAYTPPTYPLSSGPSDKVPQFSSMPNPGFQGTQGTPLKSSYPKPSQPPPYQAGQDGIHNDVEPEAEGVDMFDIVRQIIQTSTKRLLPSKPKTKSISENMQSHYKKPQTKCRDGNLNDDDRAKILKAFSEKCTWHDKQSDHIQNNFHVRASRDLSDMLREVRLKGQCPHWIGETVWQSLLEHWSSASSQSTYAKEKRNMASKKGESLQKRGSINTTQHVTRMTKKSKRSSNLNGLHKDTQIMKETGDYVDDHSRKNQEKCEARKFQTRSQNNSTSPSMHCNPAKDVVAPLSTCSGVVGDKKRSRLYDDGTISVNHKKGATSLNIPLDNARASLASSGGIAEETDRGARRAKKTSARNERGARSI